MLERLEEIWPTRVSSANATECDFAIPPHALVSCYALLPFPLVEEDSCKSLPPTSYALILLLANDMRMFKLKMKWQSIELLCSKKKILVARLIRLLFS